MHYILDQCKFGLSNTVFSIINDELIDLYATKTAILQGIASTFSGADDNDVSYFYFSGHGDCGACAWGLFTSYICPTDSLLTSYDNDISINELEVALSAIPGTKIVILDSCFSGGFIGKGKGKITISQEEMVSFNDEIINVFSQAQSKGLLTTNQYKVLTACHYYQTSVDIPPGLFTMVLCDGCGYDGNYYADTDGNTKVSLNEAYVFIDEEIYILNEYLISIGEEPFLQDVQIYPENSTFTIVEY